jgi:methyl-accepting chemotaxis protein
MQTGEYKQFVEFADRQRASAEVEQIAFVGPDGKIAFASPAECVGQAVDRALWDKAAQSNEIVISEDDQSFSAYAPLRADEHLRRLQPSVEVNQLYGLLYLKVSKEKINKMLAGATDEFQRGVRTTVAWGAGVTLGGLVVVGVLLLLVIVRPLVRALNAAIEKLNDRSNDMTHLAEQLAGNSQQLAGGAGQQAASLQETSTALEQMAAAARQNAEHARSASDMASQARASASDGQRTMSQVTQSMNAINDASAQVSKIIKIIEEIAFQTNLLALNAAVEAARAGDHGRGFAVVADEVRNLAQRSAQAARDTTVLIDSSVAKAGEGSAVATAAAGALQTIIGEVSRVAEILGGIAKASREQAQGVEQINTAVSQVDKVTQQTAASAEEAAAAAQELTSHTQTVTGTVDELTALVRGSTHGSSRG